MAVERRAVDTTRFNVEAHMPYELRLQDVQMAMQDVYDFFYDVNSLLAMKGIQRLDDMLRPAIMVFSSWADWRNSARWRGQT